MQTDKLLFTPGPLTTSATVKRAMLRDVGSRDSEFIALVADLRARLLDLAGAPADGAWTCVPVQGCGTFGVEAMVTTAVPRDGRLLVLQNGAYGQRMAAIARVQGIAVSSLTFPENRPVVPEDVDAALAADATITHVGLVHCETTTGLLNPLAQLARVVAARGRGLLVDAMSSFGVEPVDLERVPLDFLVSSANKCLHGVPGLSFVLCRSATLERCAGHARSLSLDLVEQWRGLERNGQFRFTPPTHALLALARALDELEAEGGVAGRRERYARRQRRIVAGLELLGLRSYLPADVQSSVITTFLYPDDPRFSFERMYAGLARRGFVIYPGKLTEENCFRIGSAGELPAGAVDGLLAAMREVLTEMGLLHTLDTHHG